MGRTKAFPRTPGDEGMDLRDWFAGQALAGLIVLAGTAGPDHDPMSDAEVAAAAYLQADAMLAARSPEKQG